VSKARLGNPRGTPCENFHLPGISADERERLLLRWFSVLHSRSLKTTGNVDSDGKQSATFLT